VSWDEEFDRLTKRVERVFREMEDYIARRIREEMESLYSELSSMERMLRPMWHYDGYLEPLYTIKDLGDRVVVYIDIPFAEEGAIDVRFVDGKLFIKAKLRKGISFSDWSSRFSETRFTEYRAVIDLPPGLDYSKARVRVKRGVIEIAIPKVPG